MYFNAVVTHEETRIKATKDINDAMFAVTMICRSVNEIKDYSVIDRNVFRSFVTEELAKLAFSDASVLVEEKEKLNELYENAKTNLRRLIKELIDLVDEDEDEDET